MLREDDEGGSYEGSLKYSICRGKNCREKLQIIFLYREIRRTDMNFCVKKLESFTIFGAVVFHFLKMKGSTINN